MNVRLLIAITLTAALFCSDAAVKRPVLVTCGGAAKDGGLSTAAAIGQPFGIVHDKGGNLYVADYRVREIGALIGERSQVEKRAGRLLVGVREAMSWPAEEPNDGA